MSPDHPNGGPSPLRHRNVPLAPPERRRARALLAFPLLPRWEAAPAGVGMGPPDRYPGSHEPVGNPAGAVGGPGTMPPVRAGPPRGPERMRIDGRRLGGVGCGRRPRTRNALWRTRAGGAGRRRASGLLADRRPAAAE